MCQVDIRERGSSLRVCVVQKLSVPVRTFEITSKFGSLRAFALCDSVLSKDKETYIHGTQGEGGGMYN